MKVKKFNPPPAHRNSPSKNNANQPHDSIKINNIYILALTVCLAFLIFGLAFVHHAANLSREDTIGYIQEATKQTKFAIEEHINEEYATLMAAAIVTQEKNLLTDDKELSELIKSLGANNAYVLIGFADKNGQAVWANKHNGRHRANLSRESFIKQALAGKNTLSEGQLDSLKSTVHYYSVPIFDEKTGAVKGVIFAADPQDELRMIINRSLYAGKGLAHIIDNKGNYIVESDNPLAIGTGSNIFELPVPMNEETRREILDNMAARKAGHLKMSFQGENRLAAYTPLALNDWYVFYAVPEDLVSAGLKNVTFGTAVIISIATCIFILFILLIRKVNNHNRKILEKLAFVDRVTGQRNYQKFLIDAEKILKNTKGIQYAVCYSDIKGFKYINDLFGRDIGDQMLHYLANIQQIISQEGEIYGRISGDTFVALRKYQNKHDIAHRFDSFAQQLSVFPETFQSGYKVELYGGAYVIDPADGDLSLNDMLDRAILAQKEVKLAEGTKRFCFYSNDMREQKLWEAEVESKMDAALENNEFQVYLQPKIDIQNNNRILGAEALVRWLSPEKGLIPPIHFISLFEKNGFILKLDKFVFETVCRYYKENILDGNLPAYILSVNVSRLALIQPDFISSYTAAKNFYGIPDGCIELEFTESLAWKNHTLFKTIVAECKRNGFLCSMDDFGSGHSSLNMLKSIHVDVLKLDRQFFLYGDDVKRGQKLVKNIIMMAKSLNMKTVAEGIDKEILVNQLRTMGCDAIQGYIFSKPMPLESFKQFVKSWSGGENKAIQTG